MTYLGRWQNLSPPEFNNKSIQDCTANVDIIHRAGDTHQTCVTGRLLIAYLVSMHESHDSSATTAVDVHLSLSTVKIIYVQEAPDGNITFTLGPAKGFTIRGN